MLKKAFLFVCSVSILALSMPGRASAQDEWLELLRSDIKSEKVALLTAAMQFTQEEAEVFWPIYREYDLELSKLGDARIALIKEYAANYDNLTNEKAKEIAERSMNLEEQRLKLRRSYYKKVEKALNSVEAARFMQVERQIGLLIDLQIASEMPLVKKLQ